MRFWLRKGVDGFRVDVIWHLIKDDQFRDNPVNPAYGPGMPPNQRVLPLYTADLPAVQEVITGLRRVTDEFPERLLIGEIYLPFERLAAYYGRDLAGVHLPFNFALLYALWDAGTIAALIDAYEAALPAGGWPNWVLGNHDRARIASRVGDTQARIAAMLLLTLRGTPTLYYGDEIGMRQVPIPPEQVRDPFEKRVPGIGVGRDGARTPMQWDAGAFAGFSTVEPWLPIPSCFQSRNVESELRDPASIQHLHRRLIATRRKHPALSAGQLPACAGAARPSGFCPSGGQRAHPDRVELRLRSKFDAAPAHGTRRRAGVQLRRPGDGAHERADRVAGKRGTGHRWRLTRRLLRSLFASERFLSGFECSPDSRSMRSGCHDNHQKVERYRGAPTTI